MNFSTFPDFFNALYLCAKRTFRWRAEENYQDNTSILLSSLIPSLQLYTVQPHSQPTYNISTAQPHSQPKHSEHSDPNDNTCLFHWTDSYYCTYSLIPSPHPQSQHKDTHAPIIQLHIMKIDRCNDVITSTINSKQLYICTLHTYLYWNKMVSSLLWSIVFPVCYVLSPKLYFVLSALYYSCETPSTRMC